MLGTPLHIACKKNKFEIVTKLLKYKADVNLFDLNGFLPDEMTSCRRIKQSLLTARKILEKNNQNIQSVESKLTIKYTFIEILRFLPKRPSKATGIIRIMGGLIFNYNKRYIELDPHIGSLRIFKKKTDYPHSPLYYIK